MQRRSISCSQPAPTWTLTRTSQRRTAPRSAHEGPSARLEVYIATHCPTCAESRALVRAVAEWFPDVEVSLVDLDAGGTAPERMVAVPTYLLNGKILWLCNPAPDEVFERLSAAVA